MADDFGFDSFDPSVFDFSGFDFNFPDFNFDFPDFNFDFPTFDPGQFDLGFDPSFDLGQYSPFVGDPFAIPTGDLSLPNFDLSSFLAPTSGDFNPSLNSLGSYTGFVDTPSFGSVPPLFNDMGPSFFGPEGEFPGEADAFNDLSGGGFGSNVGSADLNSDGEAVGANKLLNEVGRFGGALQTGGTSGTNELQDAQASYYKYAPLLGLGQLGLGLSGGLLGAFGPQPKPRDLSGIEKTEVQSRIDNAAARLQLDRDALEQQAAIAREKLAGEMSQAELLDRKPLFESDPRFSTLYDETTAAQQGLSPDNPEIQSMTQQIYAVRQQAATEQFTRQRDGIIERANRLGTNPAAELAQINEAEQQAKQALFVEAQQAALAFAQNRLDPSTKLLQAILQTVV